MSAERKSEHWVPEVGDLVRVIESGHEAVVVRVGDVYLGDVYLDHVETPVRWRAGVGDVYLGLLFNVGTSSEYCTIAKPADVHLVEPRFSWAPERSS